MACPSVPTSARSNTASAPWGSVSSKPGRMPIMGARGGDRRGQIAFHRPRGPVQQRGGQLKRVGPRIEGGILEKEAGSTGGLRHWSQQRPMESAAGPPVDRGGQRHSLPSRRVLWRGAKWHCRTIPTPRRQRRTGGAPAISRCGGFSEFTGPSAESDRSKSIRSGKKSSTSSRALASAGGIRVRQHIQPPRAARHIGPKRQREHVAPPRGRRC